MASSSYSNGGPPWQQQQQQHHNPQQQQHPHMASSSSSPPPLNPIASPVVSKQSCIVDENLIVMDYRPPGNSRSPYKEHQNSDNNNNVFANKKVQWVYNPVDGSVLRDHNGVPLSVDRLLATKPLRHELSTRPGPGNKKLTYISGDDVSRTLNDVFGFDGWDLDIQDVSRVDSSKDTKTGKHTVVYTARVRVTHKASGAYKEDCGAGDSTDRVYGTAIAHALKASITDAMKRAARHFGDKLGNSLYSGNFSISKAPVSLKDALDKYDIHRCNTKFGFQQPSVTNTNATSATAKMANTPSVSSTSASFHHPSTRPMPPPTASVQSSRPKLQTGEQQQQHRGAPMPKNSAPTHPGVGNEKSIAPQHNQNHWQPPQQPQPQQASKNAAATTNSHCSTTHGSSNADRQKQQHQAYIANSHAQNLSGPSNNPPQSQKQSANAGIPSSNRIAHPQVGMNTGAISSSMPASASARPTSSYGRRPALGSNNPMNANYPGSNSGDITSSGTRAATTTSTTGQPFNTNSKFNNQRRVSLDQKNAQPQQQRQPITTHTPHSSMSNVNTNVHMVSQTPSIHGGGNNNNNSYNNPHNKRPPLGAIVQNPTANGFSSEPTSKRSKHQRHHNPYNQQSTSGRKSI